MTNIRSVGVIGAGQMGQGIAQVAAEGGFEVLLFDMVDGVAMRARDRIVKSLDGMVAKGRIERAKADATISQLKPVETWDAFAQSDFVIEAITENVEIKLNTFKKLDEILRQGVIIASNTSSISLTKIAAATKRPELVIGMHFFNPVPLMRLVEVVRATQSSEQTIATAKMMGERFGKTAIVVQDAPGFVVNRVLIPMMIEAIFVLEQGLASKEDIDAGVKLGLNHPMGPIELSDFVGLDTLLAVADIYHREFGDSKYRAPIMLRNYVAAGWYGKKSGRGFYQYDEKGQKT